MPMKTSSNDASNKTTQSRKTKSKKNMKINNKSQTNKTWRNKNALGATTRNPPGKAKGSSLFLRDFISLKYHKFRQVHYPSHKHRLRWPFEIELIWISCCRFFGWENFLVRWAILLTPQIAKKSTTFWFILLQSSQHILLIF